jgi:hypothetical protein
MTPVIESDPAYTTPSSTFVLYRGRLLLIIRIVWLGHQEVIGRLGIRSGVQEETRLLSADQRKEYIHADYNGQKLVTSHRGEANKG